MHFCCVLTVDISEHHFIRVHTTGEKNDARGSPIHGFSCRVLCLHCNCDYSRCVLHVFSNMGQEELPTGSIRTTSLWKYVSTPPEQKTATRNHQWLESRIWTDNVVQVAGYPSVHFERCWAGRSMKRSRVLLISIAEYPWQ